MRRAASLLCVWAVACVGACALPAAEKLSGGVGGSGGSATGGLGGGGGAACVTPGVWPDSSVFCASGAAALCDVAGEDGTVVGPVSTFADQGASLRDGLTGLEWEKSPPSADYTWSQASAHCDALGAGFHLPTLLELSSLLDYGVSPAVASPFSPEPSFHWSASDHPQANGHWGINFGGGVVAGYADDLQAGPRKVRCVRGCVELDLTVSGAGVHDATTGLDWQTAVTTQPVGWLAALGHCAQRSGGWRLPSEKELLTIWIPEPQDHTPSLFAPDSQQAEYWSSTPKHDDPTFAWTVDFAATNYVDFATKAAAVTTALRAVRCVRGPTL